MIQNMFIQIIIIIIWITFLGKKPRGRKQGNRTGSCSESFLWELQQLRIQNKYFSNKEKATGMTYYTCLVLAAVGWNNKIITQYNKLNTVAFSFCARKPK